MLLFQKGDYNAGGGLSINSIISIDKKDFLNWK